MCERTLVLLCFLITSRFAIGNSTIRGRVIDEQSQPLPFVNVVLLNSADSAFIQGTVTKGDGTFTIETDRNDRLLKVSSVGYQTQYIQARLGNVGDIRMQPDNQTLGEVVVKGHVPSYRMTTEGIQTNVENTVLTKLGTGEDVLAHVPGITKKDGAFEVFGKGAPLIYINGRLMRDASELDQLKSESIKSVELITNPGAKYDASVKAVVKIRTKMPQGEGFGFDVCSSYYQSENTDLVEQLNWNYRHNHLDVFGTFHYALDNSHNQSTTTTLVQADTLWQQNFAQDYKPKRQTSRNVIGTNYAFDENNSIGFQYTFTLRPDAKTNSLLNSDITANGAYFDHIDNRITSRISYHPAHLLNIYYKGKMGKADIDFNTDYLYNCQNAQSVYNELSSGKDSRIVNSENNERNVLVASKLTIDYPLLGGRLMGGAEYTHTNRNDDYINPEQYVPTSFAELKETHIAPFVEYSRQISRLQLTAGLRYEWVDFDYYENSRHLDEQSRSFGNLFPSLTLSTQIKKTYLQLGYAAKTRRPTYQQLSNNVSYGNRFLIQSGNPFLNHEYIHSLSLIGVYKYLQVVLAYSDRRDAIIYWVEQQAGNSAISRISYQNIPTLKNLTVQVVAAPKFGIWSPQLSAVMLKQWMTLHTDLATYKMNDPIFQFNLDNSFNFGHGWVGSADAYLVTKGHSENLYSVRTVGAVNLSLTKSLMKDRLSIQLKGADLLHTEKHGTVMYAGSMQTEQISWYDSRQFMLTLRYKFNTTRSKYKGTGAGNDEKNRL